MMRKGTDVTVSGQPSNDSTPPSDPMTSKQKRPSRISLDNCRGGDCGDSGSTTPDAASMSGDRRDSFGKVSGTRTYSRGGGYSSNKHIYKANRDEVVSPTSSNRRGARDNGAWPNSRISTAQGSRDTLNDRSYSPRYAYNSTQSLYDPHQPEGYLGFRSSSGRGRGKAEIVGKAASPVRFHRTTQLQKNERASMRAEGSQRRTVPARRRNDSINSTQSECLPQVSDRLSVDTNVETRSVAGDGPSSPSLSYMQLCQSFESIGSFDWSQEVESEYNAKHGDERDTNAAAAAHPDRSEVMSSNDDLSSKKFNHGDSSSPAGFSMRGILRVPPGLRRGRERARNVNRKILQLYIFHREMSTASRERDPHWYFQNVLSTVDADAVEVELLMDGAYRTVKRECIDVDSDDGADVKPSVSGLTGNVISGGQAKSKPPPDDDVIVLSDSEDDDVVQAIRASIKESNQPTSTTAPLSPAPHDNSIIILDDDSPPRPAPAPVQNKTCNSTTSMLPPISSSAIPTRASTYAMSPTSTTSPTCNGDASGSIAAPTATRVPTIQPHGVISGHQPLYHQTNPLTYYQQSQWSQPAASRPQYPAPTPGTLNAGTTYQMTYKQPFGNLLGRYQAANNTNALPFNYATATAPPPQTASFAAGSNLSQVLASLVQQPYSNNTSGNGPMSQ
ncbi:unnamed protein product [Heligmosomoides polygyrus]|uniref:RanBP2-type domain-containing protein n=1 Tax=Heligmosomoides polygyrus TaxID=6339 RepID=A0A3P7X1P2_HELPZ|nr:unnamed protein product [Heligmosomoides polygyrus]